MGHENAANAKVGNECRGERDSEFPTKEAHRQHMLSRACASLRERKGAIEKAENDN